MEISEIKIVINRWNANTGYMALDATHFCAGEWWIVNKNLKIMG